MMKNFVKVGLKKMFISSLALAMVFSVASCKQDDDDDGGTASLSNSSSNVTLPESVGDNVFKGTKWEQADSESSTVFEFSDNTVTKTSNWKEDGNNCSEKETYSYTYDATQNLLYLSLKNVSEYAEYTGKTYSWSNSSEYAKFVKENFEDVEKSYLEYVTARQNARFNTMYVFKYTISDTTLKFVNYFTGSLPTIVNFSNSNLYYEDCGFEAYKENDRYYIYPTFSDGTFTGTIYIRNDVCSTLGAASGTYTTSGTGTKDCTITITFTSLPEGASVITANTAYTLKHDYESSETYTLKQ